MTMLTEQASELMKAGCPTIWGLPPASLHDRYWASRGIQVVRLGRQAVIDRKAELLLLVDAEHLILFDLKSWIELLNWTKPDMLLLRLHASKSLGYREVLAADDDGDFLRFERRYQAKQVLTTRVALTSDFELAEAWQSASSAAEGRKLLRTVVPSNYRETRSCPARIYQLNEDEELNQFAQDLVSIWTYPRSTISCACHGPSKAWVDSDTKLNGNARIIGRVWIGAGRRVDENDVIVGPAILWDDPLKRPEPNELRWDEIEPAAIGDRIRIVRHISSVYRTTKRLFDICFSIIVLILTLPLYPLVMLAIFLEDGRPFFFAHQRETLEGQTFSCLKFRSMRKDALLMTTELASQNQADGPQFFIDNDPRITRIGKIMRKTHLDELPQFINVLMGDMSVVGPRPSPRGENQYCAEWREARLSVRPGITGLWQVRRTRIKGRDFQEWIKYDIQYVETMNWFLDIKLIWQTIVVIARRTVRL